MAKPVDHSSTWLGEAESKRELTHDTGYNYNSYYGYDYGQDYYYYNYSYDYYSYYNYYDNSYYGSYDDKNGYSYSYYDSGYYDYSQDYYTNDYYGHDYRYSYMYYAEGDGNNDIDSKYTGHQDWDDWHEEGGQSKDDEWTGDINDFLEGENDHDHEEALWSWDNEGPTFWDRLGEMVTVEHQQYEIAHDLSWVTWAYEDVDFWDWFWLWFGELDETWEFDHEPGFVQRDENYEWEWFQNHTKGSNSTLDSMRIDRDDSQQFSWEQWDEYWRDYDAAKLAPDGYIHHKMVDGKNVTEKIAQDEDTVCAAGSYLNDGNTCQPCAPGCTHCESLGHCYACSNNFEAVTGPDFGFCFPKCFHGMYRQTVFDNSDDFLAQIGVLEEEREADADMKLVVPPHLMLQTCKPCNDGCRGCFAGIDGAQFCYECIHGYVYDQSEAQCVVDPDWNNSESEIKVKASKKTINQCDELKIRLDPMAGFNVTESLKEIRWNIHIQDMEVSDEMNAKLQDLISRVNEKQSFTFSHEFTHQLEIGAKVKIVGFAVGKDGAIVHDNEIIEVVGAPEYSLKFEKSYYILAEEGLDMEITKDQAKCPRPESTVRQLDLADWLRVTCKLYTIQKQLVAELPKCQIAENLLLAGQDYLVELKWRSDKSELKAEVHKRDSVHHIRVTTQTDKTICHFEEGDDITVDKSQSHLIKPKLEGQDFLISRTSWSCETTDGQPCPEQDNAPTSQIQTSKYIPADYLPDNANFRYTLKLEAENGTDFDTLSSCSINLKTVPKGLSDTVQTVKLQIFDQVPLIGFLDPKEDHTFYCGPSSGSQAASDSYLYDIGIEKVSEDARPASDPLVSSPDASKDDSLLVAVGQIEIGNEYKVSCSMWNEAHTIYGQVSKTYNSYEFDDPITMRVGPARGAPYATTFAIDVLKPSSEALKCVIGYQNENGEMIIEDYSIEGQRFSSSNQHLKTTLPSPADQSNLLVVFTRCEDNLGRTKTAAVGVTIEGGDTINFDKSTDRYVETIKRAVEAGAQTRVSDIVSLAAAANVGDQPSGAQNKTDQLKESVKILSSAIANQKQIKSSETSQLSKVLKDLSVSISADSDLSQDAKLTKSTLEAVGNVLEGSSASDKVDTYQPINSETFSELASTVDSLMTSSTSPDDETKNAALQVTSQLFNEGINRLASSMRSGEDEGAVQHFHGENFEMEVQKKTKQEFELKGVNQINLKSSKTATEELKVEIPFDKLFNDVEDIIFASSFSSETGSDELLAERQDSRKVEQATMLSGVVSISARATDNRFSSTKDTVISEIEVKNLDNPIKLDIPLTDGVKNPELTQCMYLDEKLNQWQVLDSSPSCDPPRLGQTSVTCCSTHLTTFTVQEITPKKQDQRVAPGKVLTQASPVTVGDVPVEVQEDNSICSYHAHYVLFTMLFTGIFACIGCCLDCKQKNKKTLDKQADISTKGRHQHVGSIDKSIQLGPLSGTQVTVQQASQMNVTPDQESIHRPNSQAPVNLSDVKLQMDPLSGGSMSSLGGSNSDLQRMSAVSLGGDGNQSNSESDLGLSKKLKELENAPVDKSFGRLFCNSFKFYGRLMGVCYSHTPKLGRAAKSLNLCTQVMLMATIVTLYGLFGSNWKLNGGDYIAVFILMRLFQALFGFGMMRSESTGKGFVCASTTLFLVVYFICGVIVYNVPEREERSVQHDVINDSLKVLMIELFLWDMFLMPLTLAATVKVFKTRRGLTNHFEACLV